MAEIPLERLLGPAVIIDISSRATLDPDAQLQVNDLTTWEEVYGRIPHNAIVIMNSGWEKNWPNMTRIFGSSGRDTTNFHFPGIDPTAAKWLVEERNIAGVGVDTPSLDYGPSIDFQTHVIVSEDNIFGLENVMNLDKLPEGGAIIHVMPMKIDGGSGAPARIMGMVGQQMCGSPPRECNYTLAMTSLIASIMTSIVTSLNQWPHWWIHGHYWQCHCVIDIYDATEADNLWHHWWYTWLADTPNYHWISHLWWNNRWFHQQCWISDIDWMMLLMTWQINHVTEGQAM